MARESCAARSHQLKAGEYMSSSNSAANETQPDLPFVPGPADHQAARGTRTANVAVLCAVISLAGAVTVVVGILFGVMALSTGVMAARRAARGVNLGRRRAWVAAVAGAVGIVLSVVLLATGASLINEHSRSELNACKQRANGDQDQINNCLQKYKGQYDH
jgi:hypothetical protein